MSLQDSKSAFLSNDFHVINSTIQKYVAIILDGFFTC